jgi:dTDP-4-amino-4,6-dideoxygalactose transaminase
VSDVTARPLPLFDIGRAFSEIEEELVGTFRRLGAQGAFSLGEELRLFEAEYAEYCGAKHAIGVCDGTDALKLALLGLGVGPGDEVVTVPMTFIATLEAIAGTGATPVLADVDPVTRCLDPAALEAVVTDRTKAILPVHLYGRPAPMAEIRAIAERAGARIVEDAAQAHGATLDGVRTGALGDAAGFSFYPTKNLGALGDGGAVVTNDDEVAAVVRSLRHHGSAPDDANVHVRRGWTGRLDNLQAAFLRIKLRNLDRDNDQRRAGADRYRELLADAPLTLPPGDPEGGRQVHHLFVVEVEGRDAVRAALNQQGIGAGIHYPTPAHLQPAWSELGGEGDFPHAERLGRTALSLPLFPGIADDEIERVATALREALA